MEDILDVSAPERPRNVKQRKSLQDCHEQRLRR